MQPAETGQRAERILAEVERAVVGKREALELVLLGILAGRACAARGLPGLAKTLMARSFAQAAGVGSRGCSSRPTVPADITGSAMFNQRDDEFEFRPGRSSPTCCSRTRSTARRRRRRPRCSRRCRSGR